MPQIQLNDRLYREAQRRASAAGFETVDDYVAEIVQEDADNLNYLFTAERLAKIDRAVAQIDGGQGITSEQVREHFREKHEG